MKCSKWYSVVKAVISVPTTRPFMKLKEGSSRANISRSSSSTSSFSSTTGEGEALEELDTVRPQRAQSSSAHGHRYC